MKWSCTEKMGGWVITLRFGCVELNRFVDRYLWEHSVCQNIELGAIVETMKKEVSGFVR